LRDSINCIVHSSIPFGRIGKAIAKYLNEIPEDYFNGRKYTPAYFMHIGPYIDGTRWEMNNNLKKAVKILLIHS